MAITELSVNSGNTTQAAELENNNTLQLNMMEGLDMGLPEKIQELLAPVYESFPFLANTFLDIPLANLIAATLVFFLFLFLRHLFTTIVTVSLQELAKKTSTYYDNRIISALKGPLSFTFIIIGLHLFFILIFKETDTIKHILNTMVIYTIFWAILFNHEQQNPKGQENCSLDTIVQ